MRVAVGVKVQVGGGVAVGVGDGGGVSPGRRVAVSVGVGVMVDVGVGMGVSVGGRNVRVGHRVAVAVAGVAADRMFCSWRVNTLLPKMVQIKMPTMPPPISSCRSRSVSGEKVNGLAIAVAPIWDRLFF